TYNTRIEYPNGLETHLKYLVSFGEYVTAKWRSAYAEIWGCPLIDRYSLSEVFGGATQSPVCGWYHFDPFVIPEVVSNRTKKPIAEGIGYLLLTALYPFQEAQPLVRYFTGDLVEVTHTKSSHPDCLAVRPLGRAVYGVPAADSDEWLLTPAKVM